MFGLPNNIHARLSASVLSYSYDLNITVSISDIYHSLLSNRQTLTDLEKRLVANLGTSVEMQQLINTVLETSYGYAITLPPVKLTPLSQYTTDYPTIYPTYTSQTPSSLSPSSQIPTTQSPSSLSPSSQTPSSLSPSSQTPSSLSPTTQTPSSQIPSSLSPSSLSPSSLSPTTQTPSSQIPSSQIPTSLSPTSQSPTTQTPTSKSPFAPWTYVVSTTPYMKPTVAVFNTNAPTPSFRPLSDTNSGCSETGSIAVVFVSGMVIGAMLLSVFTILRKYCRVHPENDN